MTRLIVPIILLVAALGLFVIYTNPTFQEVKELRTQAASYDEALNKSQELRAVRDELLAKRNTFKTESVQKLGRMLPDNVDNIRLIIDINNIAARHDLTLTDVSLGEVVGGASGKRNPAAVGASGDPVGSVTVGFSVLATYDELLAFLVDMEHSLRIVDVEGLSFKASPQGRTTHAFTIRTYWLR